MPRARRSNQAKPCGTCYSDAYRIARELQKASGSDIDDTDILLVHGTVWPDDSEKRFGHAWVEIDSEEMVVEPEHNTSFNRTVFYSALDAKAKHKYTVHEAMITMVRNGHMGPWR